MKSPFTNTYRPRYTRSCRVEGNLHDSFNDALFGFHARWRLYAFVNTADPVKEAKHAVLDIQYPITEGNPKIEFDWTLWLEDAGGRELARVKVGECITPYDDTNDYIIGEPKPNGEVHGTANTVTDLRHELRLFLPANITRQLAATNDLDSWVAESLARTWAWHLNHEKFHAPAEDLAVAWKQATASQPRKKNSDDRR